MNEEILNSLEQFLLRYEESREKNKIYEESYDEAKRFIYDNSRLPKGKLAVCGNDKGLIDNMQSEAAHALDSFGLSFIVQYLYSVAQREKVSIPAEMEKRIEEMRIYRDETYQELIKARTIYRLNHK